MKMDRFPLAAVVLLLSACGGGSSGDSFNSSFNGTVNLNGTRYECPSQKTYDACNNSSNRDCSGCTSNSDNNGATITAVCGATSSSLNRYLVTQDGCTVNLSSGKQTGVCVSGSLRLLSGTGFTKAQVSSQGSSFSNGLTINGVSLTCSTI